MPTRTVANFLAQQTGNAKKNRQSKKTSVKKRYRLVSHAEQSESSLKAATCFDSQNLSQRGTQKKQQKPRKLRSILCFGSMQKENCDKPLFKEATICVKTDSPIEDDNDRNKNINLWDKKKTRL